MSGSISPNPENWTAVANGSNELKAGFLGNWTPASGNGFVQRRGSASTVLPISLPGKQPILRSPQESAQSNRDLNLNFAHNPVDLSFSRSVKPIDAACSG